MEKLVTPDVLIPSRRTKEIAAGKVVAFDSGSQGHMDCLPKVDLIVDQLDEILTDVWELTVLVDEMDGTIRHQKEVPFDVAATLADMERDAKTWPGMKLFKAIEQNMVQSSDLICVPGDGHGGVFGIAYNNACPCRHETSLTGYGADSVSAPVATTEGATSVVGDIVRDGADITPASPDSAVEESAATGAAGSERSLRRPRPICDEESP